MVGVVLGPRIIGRWLDEQRQKRIQELIAEKLDEVAWPREELRQIENRRERVVR